MNDRSHSMLCERAAVEFEVRRWGGCIPASSRKGEV